MIGEKEKKFIETMLGVLDEREKRLFLGSYAESLGRGGVSELSRLTGISRTTITTGIKELQQPDGMPRTGPGERKRVRTPGAGRKPIEMKYPHIREELIGMMEGNTGDGSGYPLCWTTKGLRKLQEELRAKEICVNHATIGALMNDMGFRLQAYRRGRGGEKAAQWQGARLQMIAEEAGRFLEENLPVICLSVQKGQQITNPEEAGEEDGPEACADRERNGTASIKEESHALSEYPGCIQDEDWSGKADTGALAADSVLSWWNSMGRERYPDAGRLMIAVDWEVRKDGQHRMWLSFLQEVANETDLELHVYHLPPATIRWNGIEQSLTSQIAVSHRGSPRETVRVAIDLLARPARADSAQERENGRLREYRMGLEEQSMPQGIGVSEDEGWNYMIVPQTQHRTAPLG